MNSHRALLFSPKMTPSPYFFSPHLSCLREKSPWFLRKTILLLPCVPRFAVVSILHFSFLTGALPGIPKSVKAQHFGDTAVPCLVALLLLVALWQFSRGWPVASLPHSSSCTLCLHGDCGFHTIAPRPPFLPRSSLHQNPAVLPVTVARVLCSICACFLPSSGLSSAFWWLWIPLVLLPSP